MGAFDITILLILLTAVIISFFFLRGLLIWYFKINKITELLEKIEKNTRKKDEENL